MSNKKYAVSPSRTYVAMCNAANFDGFYFKKFTLPTDVGNDSGAAAWYFLNRLNFSACIETCITIEDFSNVTDQT